jgi:hypothetical protein
MESKSATNWLQSNPVRALCAAFLKRVMAHYRVKLARSDGGGVFSDRGIRHETQHSQVQIVTPFCV